MQRYGAVGVVAVVDEPEQFRCGRQLCDGIARTGEDVGEGVVDALGDGGLIRLAPWSRAAS